MEQRCPRCNPFSPKVIALYKRFKETADPEQRGELLLQLAHSFAEEYDASDDHWQENFHQVVDDYHQAFLRYNQAGLRMGRVLSQVLEGYTEDEAGHDITLTAAKVTEPSVN